MRQAMRARKKEMRKALLSMRKAAREKMDQLPAVQRAKARRRRIRRAIGIAIVVLLLLLIRCDCGPGVPPEGPKVEAPVPNEIKPKKKVTVRVGPKKPLQGDGTKQNRGNLGIGPHR